MLPEGIDYPAHIGVLGFPLRKSEYFYSIRGSIEFVVDHAKLVREILSYIGSLSLPDIEQLSNSVVRGNASPQDLAKNAWKVVAWYALIQPYQHPSREHYFNVEPFIRHIEKDADTLYTYAVILLKTPSKEVYARLRNLHPGVAAKYWEYCRDHAVVSGSMDINSWLYNW